MARRLRAVQDRLAASERAVRQRGGRLRDACVGTRRAETASVATETAAAAATADAATEPALPATAEAATATEAAAAADGVAALARRAERGLSRFGVPSV